jgi:hypothetical protein
LSRVIHNFSGGRMISHSFSFNMFLRKPLEICFRLGLRTFKNRHDVYVFQWNKLYREIYICVYNYTSVGENYDQKILRRCSFHLDLKIKKCLIGGGKKCERQAHKITRREINFDMKYMLSKWRDEYGSRVQPGIYLIYGSILLPVLYRDKLSR